MTKREKITLIMNIISLLLSTFTLGIMVGKRLAFEEPKD